MAPQDSEQPNIQSLGLDPHKSEPVQLDWLLYGFPHFHLPGSDFLAQVFPPGFLSPEERSNPGSPFQSSSEVSDDLEDEPLEQPATEPFDGLGHELPSQPTAESCDDLGDELLGQPVTEPFDGLGHELPGQPNAESFDDLGDEPLGQPLSELFGDLADELLVQLTTDPSIQAMTGFSSYSIHLEETAEDWVRTLISMISQMMFVSGETSEASVETTTIIEEIVHTQVTEILRRSTQLANRRGQRSITIHDLFFLIRHDKAKVSRLMTFLSWKDVRKTAKDSDEKGGDAADLGAGEDALGGGEAGGAVAGPVVGDTVKKNKRTRITLPWDVSSYYSEQVPECDDDDEEEEEEMNAANMKRLNSADERTKNMTKEEYVHYSECRQASFTFRKAKRFRDWAGFGIVTDSKPNDDIVDILGFLTFEIVQTLTEEALKVKAEEDLTKNRNGDPAANSNKRKRETGLFDPPEEGRAPVGPKHIQEAYRRLQQRPIPGRGKRVWLGGSMALQRTELKLI